MLLKILHNHIIFKLGITALALSIHCIVQDISVIARNRSLFNAKNGGKPIWSI
jgi:hypothetical protein